MKTSFCRSCFYPASHPLGLSLNVDGICRGCMVHQEKYTLDWNLRAQLLDKAVSPYRSNSPDYYDCIVPINGGGDCFFMVNYVKNILKLNPLCVIYNSLYLTRVGHRNLSTLRKMFNVDIHMHTPAVSKSLHSQKQPFIIYIRCIGMSMLVRHHFLPN